MNKILIMFTASIILGGCAGNVDRTFTPKSTVRVVSSMSYPQFPNIEPLPDVAVLPFEADLPRDTTIVSVKNISECRREKIKDPVTGKDKFVNLEMMSPEDKPHVVLPVKEQTVAWWKKCGENPIAPNSNIFIGFSQIEWNIVLENFAKLRERIWQYKQRVNEINRQRQEWRDKAEEERLRLANERKEAEVEAKPAENPEKPEEKSLIKKIFD